MQKKIQYQIDIFGNEIPIKQVILKEKCDKSWYRKVLKGFKKVGVDSGFNKNFNK